MTTKIKASNIETGAITADKLEATLDLSTKTVTLPSGGYATESYVTTQIGNVIGGAPGALDTLNELAAALGDDENFATTVTNALALKANSADVYTQSEVDAAIANNQAVFSGTTAPSSPSVGDLWYDTNTDVRALKVYDGTEFVKVSLSFPVLSSISGNIYNGSASTLTLSGSNFLYPNTMVVSFTVGGSTYTATATTTDDGTATVSVPSSVYGLAAGTSVSIKVTNNDGGDSSAVSKTVMTLPSGGTVYTYGNYRVHAFTSSSSFTMPAGFTNTVDYMLVAGGGGCGDASGWGGGAGAGGLIYQSGQTISSGSYTVTIGAGGAPSNQGASTTVFGQTAVGGGRGGDNAINNGGNGGSGGGGRGDPPGIIGGSGTSGQGFAGGAGYDPSPGESGGGGGGAGGAGQAGSGTSAGNGGLGANYSSVFGTTYGEGGYFASGGGGSIGRPDQLTYSNASESASSGWAYPGGGGTGGASGYGGGANVAAANGQSNTGGGCGAGSGTGSGGSGIVLIRYQL